MQFLKEQIHLCELTGETLNALIFKSQIIFKNLEQILVPQFLTVLAVSCASTHHLFSTNAVQKKYNVSPCAILNCLVATLKESKINKCK